ncbi:MAG: class A beta-lactamase-related serine hydrolase [Bacteroidetes bacterium]|nr:class A beta-lactamase-related serine hydrolase [Bacteroidota bacterium]
MASIFSKKVSVLSLLVITTITGCSSYIITKKFSNCEDVVASAVGVAEPKSCEYNIKRMTGYKYINPIMFVDKGCESEEFAPLKHEVAKIIENFKMKDELISASVYLKEYNQNTWMGINEEEKYKPGSLLKVPELITYLRMAEANPGLLDKVISYDHPFTNNKDPKILSQSIQVGHKYTIRELLDYKISYSDNNATMLLNNAMDEKMFYKTFTDFGLAPPDMKASTYPISSKDFSLFMRALYNGSYLSKNNSEFATELLSKCDYKEGMIKGLPMGVKIIHKFGEAGNDLGLELHESGIIYINNFAYLLTVMTKGKDLTKLPEVIRQISEKAYKTMEKRAKGIS